MNIKQIIQFEEKNSVWNIFFKHIPVWSYLRGAFNQQHLPYKPKIKFAWSDIRGLYTFCSLIWKKNHVVVFISARPDLIEYTKLCLQKKFPTEEKIIFYRTEILQGNTFFIESLRFIFRKLFWLLHLNFYKSTILELKIIEKKNKYSQIKDLIGDYYFNYFLSFFLKNSVAVLYSNAVIPRTERYLNLYHSIEIQHGVIHNAHLDYIHSPFIKNKLYCYSKLVQKNLTDWKFSGKVIVIPKIPKKESIIKKEIVIFSTVDQRYSKLIEELSYMMELKGWDFNIKLHPRDLYPYQRSLKEKFLNEIDPLSVKIPILPDTSLISDCFLNNKYFIYLSTGSKKNIEEIRSYLIEKYYIYENRNINFDIAFDLGQLIKKMEKVYEDEN
ncbi:MAG: hypothetical protein Q4A62_01395 [Eikenella sp.]|nr:hypothetical protein [Eikenella sp.]